MMEGGGSKNLNYLVIYHDEFTRSAGTGGEPSQTSQKSSKKKGGAASVAASVIEGQDNTEQPIVVCCFSLHVHAIRSFADLRVLHVRKRFRKRGFGAAAVAIVKE
jgi:hypothetical protein